MGEYDSAKHSTRLAAYFLIFVSPSVTLKYVLIRLMFMSLVQCCLLRVWAGAGLCRVDTSKLRSRLILYEFLGLVDPFRGGVPLAPLAPLAPARDWTGLPPGAVLTPGASSEASL